MLLENVGMMCAEKVYEQVAGCFCDLGSCTMLAQSCQHLI